MTRLETLSPDLAAKIQQASAAQQRAASLAACESAISHAKVDHPLVNRALEKVRAFGFFTPAEQSELDALAARLDEEYFILQEAAEEGRANTEDYMRVFSQARAVAALAFAGGEDASESVTEAIYEAAAMTDNQDELSARILSVLE